MKKLATSYDAIKLGCKGIEKQTHSYSIDHVLQFIIQDSPYGRYEDFANNIAKGWHFYVNGQEVALNVVIYEDNYRSLVDRHSADNEMYLRLMHVLTGMSNIAPSSLRIPSLAETTENFLVKINSYYGETN